MTDLEKRVIKRNRKIAKRLKENYRLARNYGYTSTEASLLMNRGKDTITHDALKEGRVQSNSLQV